MSEHEQTRTSPHDALLAAADFIETTSGIGTRTNDYADGWYDCLEQVLLELRARAHAVQVGGDRG